MYYIFYAFIWTISWLPLRLLFVISDLIYPIVYYVIGYRKKVVRKNLLSAFPEKSKDEILQIEKKFYRYFCDLMFETIRQLHAPRAEMMKRMNFENIHLLLEQSRLGKSVMLMTAHYCNWEWTSVICLHLPPDFLAYPVYQQLKSKHFDKLMYKLRNRYGAVNVEKSELVRKMLDMRTMGVNGVFGMISDQSPMARNIRYRMNFLNQDTPVFLGSEQLAKKYDYPVYYLDIQRVKRGYYRVVVKPIALSPTQTSEYEITNQFMKQLEENILEKPEFWLWSHNRWKHSKK